MRLPQKDGVIDIEQVKTMVDMFLDAGFNYFDTAFAYAGSEDAIRQALVERVPRERFFLATKNAAWLNCKTREDAIKQFETSLRQTGAGYFDFICCTIWANPARRFSTTSICGAGFWRKKERGLLGTPVFLSTPRLRSWTKFSTRIPKRSLCSCR